MIKKIFYILCLICICTVILPVSVFAAETEPNFAFELTVDGADTKRVNTGDIITLHLNLEKTNSSKSYTMYAMQDEIQYDGSFFELVEGSSMLYTGVAAKDIANVDRHRELYMNYLSMSGGTQWNANTLVGTVQLKVIGKSGVTKITNQDYLVSLQDGSGSYPCSANEVTIILSTDCTVEFMSNGGSEIENQIVQYGEKIAQPEEPTREGFHFGGWYKDIHLSEEWIFEEDVVEGNMTLYAKWIEGGVETSDETMWLLWIVLIIILSLVFCYLWKKYQRRR